MHKKYHEKFKILDIFAVTTQAHEGIETTLLNICFIKSGVTTQAHEGIETAAFGPAACNPEVTTQAHEGIETKVQTSSACSRQKIYFCWLYAPH